MPLSSIETLKNAAVAWGVPLAYAICCCVAHRLTAPKEARASNDIAPTYAAPPIHPLLLGALWFRKEGSRNNEVNGCSVALATVVRMIGREVASFTDPGGSKTALSADQKESEGSAGSNTGRTRRRLFSRRARKEPPYRTQFRLAICAEDLDRHDRDACELVMPPHAQSAALEDVCAYARDPGLHLSQLSMIIPGQAGELCVDGLARQPGVFYSVFFSSVISFTMGMWGFLGFLFMGIESSMPVLAAEFVFACAILLVRLAAVDLGLRATPKGARIIAQAAANIRWAKGVVDGTIAMPQGLSATEIADLLAVLLATGHHDLAADMADVLRRNEHMSCDNVPEARQALDFCARRPLAVSTPPLLYKASPVELILQNVRDIVAAIHR